MDNNDMCVHFLLGKALQKASQITKSKLNSYGITPVQFAVLRQLWISDGQLGSKLGDRLHMDSATMTGILDRMEQKEFVQRQSDPRDRRNRIVYLTEKGRDLEDPLNQKMEEWNKELMTGFNEDDILTFKRMLNTIGFRNIHQS
ncbi:MarR family transcriptional regulator [Metabacillus idriensis]|uniref:MarR family winged helix-turn-helix transcriptional regulator n=1 Tax=Metabacillus idriensis TaxID=324768 RepID=UPI00281474BE|nr:MarR family transcriptional regulator [Metabacillus idriensis]MDR0140189.1 MarR family transcriptional regulator [Metabacillus idriensis]